MIDAYDDRQKRLQELMQGALDAQPAPLQFPEMKPMEMPTLDSGPSVLNQSASAISGMLMNRRKPASFLGLARPKPELLSTPTAPINKPLLKPMPLRPL